MGNNVLDKLPSKVVNNEPVVVDGEGGCGGKLNSHLDHLLNQLMFNRSLIIAQLLHKPAKNKIKQQESK